MSPVQECEYRLRGPASANDRPRLYYWVGRPFGVDMPAELRNPPPVVIRTLQGLAAATLSTSGHELCFAPQGSLYLLHSIRTSHDVGGTSAALAFRRIRGTSAPNAAASGTAVVELTGDAGASTHSMVAAGARTVRDVTLISDEASRIFRPTDRLCVVGSGTLTGLAGVQIVILFTRFNG